jgi:hypothetical protein
MDRRRMKWNWPIIGLGLLLNSTIVWGQAAQSTGAANSDADSTNAATNPATPKLTLQAWDNWVPHASGAEGRSGNSLLSRNIIPVKTFGVMNLVHVEIPIVTNPTVPGGSETGVGGTTLYNFSVVKVHTTTYGAGPLVVLPTENNTYFGPQKWQAGIAAIVMDAPKWGLLGGIFTYQHAFGSGDGPITQQATFQTFIHYNLGDGFYLQSEGVTAMNSGPGVRVVPVGLGIGKAWAYVSGRTFSAFVEPQYSVWRRGEGAPTWQIFSGISFQIPVSFKLWDKTESSTK